MNGADALCATLLAEGIDTCFANPGTSEMHFVAALDRRPEMRCVLGLFEGVVTGAADGYARMAGKPAATLLHTGPGLANGLANVHNARRAGTAMINIVGDHATHHRAYDAPLASDIEGLARPMSHWVRTIETADAVSRNTAEAISAARAGGGRISTLVLPADSAWNPTSAALVSCQPPAPSAPVDVQTVHRVAQAIRKGGPTLLLLGQQVLRGRALDTAGRIARKTGVRLLADAQSGRTERGAGRVAVDRMPMGIDAAIPALAGLANLVLIGAREPVAFFAYPGRPNRPRPHGCQVHELAAPQDNAEDALCALAEALGVQSDTPPGHERLDRPALPKGVLTPAAVVATVAALLPDQAIVCDEAITAGRHIGPLMRAAAAHDYLPLTGGAIGIGLPLATGAAIACPTRKVVCLQADGSGMYTVQALWTQARENTDVITVVFANRTYAILHGELSRVGAAAPGHNARRMLDLQAPTLDWTALARGMGVEAVRADTVAALADALRSAIARRGPMLIEAVV